jgi:hypothetical protein
MGLIQELRDLVPIYLNHIMFAKDSSNKIFLPPRHEGTKFNYNKPLTFVSWCLGGYSFRFIRVGNLGIEGILSLLIYRFDPLIPQLIPQSLNPSIPQSLNPPIPQSLNLVQIDIDSVQKS